MVSFSYSIDNWYKCMPFISSNRYRFVVFSFSQEFTLQNMTVLAVQDLSLYEGQILSFLVLMEQEDYYLISSQVKIHGYFDTQILWIKL